MVEMYESWARDLYVNKEGSVPIAEKYIKVPIYGQQTKQLY
jgi:hypothetical protein